MTWKTTENGGKNGKRWKYGRKNYGKKQQKKRWKTDGKMTENCGKTTEKQQKNGHHAFLENVTHFWKNLTQRYFLPGKIPPYSPSQVAIFWRVAKHGKREKCRKSAEKVQKISGKMVITHFWKTSRIFRKTLHKGTFRLWRLVSKKWSSRKVTWCTRNIMKGERQSSKITNFAWRHLNRT